MHKNKRNSGLLLPLNSIPSNENIGTISKSAKKVVDILKESGTKYWQICPFTHTDHLNSPYISHSAFAGNPLLICLEDLYDRGFLPTRLKPEAPSDKIDYDTLQIKKINILRKSFNYFLKKCTTQQKNSFERFIEENSFWLRDYSNFMAMKEIYHEMKWTEWPDVPQTKEFQIQVRFFNYCQFCFFSQWQDLKNYANDNGVQILGDIPIFLSYDSADVWGTPHNFLLDEEKKPTYLTGVPPDYFSETGQLWGNPHYNWAYMKKNNYSWWMSVLKHMAKHFDYVRIDHFRGLIASWKVPYGSKTAINGHWAKGPGSHFFKILKKEIPSMPFFVEDLGIITPAVKRVKNEFGLTGMKVLQEYFEGLERMNTIAKSIENDSISYLGTHDNPTTLGWLQSLPKNKFNKISDFFNSTNKKELLKQLTRYLWSTKSNLTIATAQDLLALDNCARINTPGSFKDIYRWKLQSSDQLEIIRSSLKELNTEHKRIR